ncbi:MAG: cobalt-zinc-cadmium efflux system membrane fusion protein [Myxococcota bacterium]|jgi:cobalt-zinc-cadmium efflux system membrane fusion protein
MILALLLIGCTRPPEPENHDDHDDAHEDGERTVELSEAAMAAARLTIAPATTGTLQGTLTMPARITMDPRREALVSAWIAGQLDAIRVRPGETVAAGQLLATVQSPELGEAIAAFRSAAARDAAADIRLERLNRLEEAGVAAHAQVLEAEADHAGAEGALEAAEERLRIFGVDPTIGDPHAGEHYASHVPVASPIAGKVLSSNVSVGARVEPGDTLFHIGDLDEVWLELDVYERDLSQVHTKQALTFTVEAWPGETFRGQVEQVGDWLSPDTRTISVQAVVDNADHRLKPNMFAQATLTLDTTDAPTGVLLPVESVQEMDGVEVVFVEAEDRHFTARPVVISARSAGQILIASGITVGESVVTAGGFTLKSELEKGELGSGHAH